MNFDKPDEQDIKGQLVTSYTSSLYREGDIIIDALGQRWICTATNKFHEGESQSTPEKKED